MNNGSLTLNGITDAQLSLLLLERLLMRMMAIWCRSGSKDRGLPGRFLLVGTRLQLT